MLAFGFLGTLVVIQVDADKTGQDLDSGVGVEWVKQFTGETVDRLNSGQVEQLNSRQVEVGFGWFLVVSDKTCKKWNLLYSRLSELLTACAVA